MAADDRAERTKDDLCAGVPLADRAGQKPRVRLGVGVADNQIGASVRVVAVFLQPGGQRKQR